MNSTDGKTRRLLDRLGGGLVERRIHLMALRRRQRPRPLKVPMICVECSKGYDDPGFVYYAGDRQYGPAYWSDKGVLCSPKCATDHFLKRQAAGDPMTVPAPKPGVSG